MANKSFLWINFKLPACFSGFPSCPWTNPHILTVKNRHTDVCESRCQRRAVWTAPVTEKLMCEVLTFPSLSLRARRAAQIWACPWASGCTWLIADPLPASASPPVVWDKGGAQWAYREGGLGGALEVWGGYTGHPEAALVCVFRMSKRWPGKPRRTTFQVSRQRGQQKPNMLRKFVFCTKSCPSSYLYLCFHILLKGNVAPPCLTSTCQESSSLRLPTCG